MNKLPKPEQLNTTATLSDGKKTYSFLLDPESLEWSYNAQFVNNSVLLSNNPDNVFKNSASTLTIPRVLFVSQGMVKDVSGKIKELADFVSSGTELIFSFGGTRVERVYISSFQVTERQWRGNRCTQAEGSITLLISRDPVTSSVNSAQVPKYPTTNLGEVSGNKNTPVPSNKVTERELVTIRDRVTNDIKSPTNRRKLGLPVGVPLTVTTEAKGRVIGVTISNKGTRYSFVYSEYKRILGL